MLNERQYSRINDICGWVVFAIALATYWLTLEPTASLWDCGEYVAQAAMLEVGHPPGNPIFMLMGRVFCNFASDASQMALMVNAMSGLLSALTILLLFWTITALVVKHMRKGETMSRSALVATMGSGVVGALAYAWSDTFWYSAVEAEVYAFSSFCTALVVWLALKWERRADEPHSDRYLVLIAYVIGVSVAVHLLNLLCIPAIALIYARRRWGHLSWKRTMVVLLMSFVVVGLILFGLVPGFVKMAQGMELWCVNSLGMPYNSGALIYVAIAVVIMAWALVELAVQRSAWRVRLSVASAILVSGLLCIGDGLLSVVLPAVMCLWVLFFDRRLSVRLYNMVVWSIFVIFVGYSSYAVILLRANANPPMNQNAVDNLFALSSYLNREQYKAHPLLYGPTPFSERVKLEYESIDTLSGEVSYTYGSAHKKKGKARYVKAAGNQVPELTSGFATADDSLSNAALLERGGDCYLFNDYDYEYVMTPELNMVLPRIFSSSHIDAYKGWTGMTPENMDSVEVSDAVNADGDFVVMADPATGERTARRLPRPTFVQNMSYLFGYQIGYMYMRYFMWNFCGRQNDLQSQGQADAGNFITGISWADDAMLGNQSLIPDAIGRDNKGHNVYYMLPLLLGVLGIIWQCRRSRDGRGQAFMVFMLFFMTGIAIVIYLNQTPGEPRERDYAFAGSFYAFAIWIGMGVMMLYRLVESATKRLRLGKNAVAWVAVVIGLCVPLQMLSQTADDHDRSGRTIARDAAVNYLESLEPNAILFTNGDNFTFPLWYAQEVEGVRRDVRIINLAYLSTEWYASQLMLPVYDAAPVPTTATPQDIAMRRRKIAYFFDCDATPTDAVESLREIYADSASDNHRRLPRVAHPVITVPLDREALLRAGVVEESDTAHLPQVMTIDMRKMLSGRTSYIRMDELLMLDIIATNAANGWERPIYWMNMCSGKDLLGFSPYLRQEALAYRLTPLNRAGCISIDTDRSLAAIDRFAWGEKTADRRPYYDDMNGKMLSYQRRMLIELATALIDEAEMMPLQRTQKLDDALRLLTIIADYMPAEAYRYVTYTKDYVPRSEAVDIARCYIRISEFTHDESLKTIARDLLTTAIYEGAKYYRYYHSLGSKAAYTTAYTSLAARNFFEAIDLYRQHFGDDAELRERLPYVDFDKAEKSWSLYHTRQTLLRDARPLSRYDALELSQRERESQALKHADSTMSQRLQRYLECGGSIEQLQSFAEFSEFPFDKYVEPTSMDSQSIDETTSFEKN